MNYVERYLERYNGTTAKRFGLSLDFWLPLTELILVRRSDTLLVRLRPATTQGTDASGYFDGELVHVWPVDGSAPLRVRSHDLDYREDCETEGERVSDALGRFDHEVKCVTVATYYHPTRDDAMDLQRSLVIYKPNELIRRCQPQPQQGVA